MSSPGGDTVQLLETADSLRRIGLVVDVVLADCKMDYRDYDLIHFFNIIRPSDILVHVRKSLLPYVVSTIFVDYSNTEKSKGGMWNAANYLFGADGLEYLKTVARFFFNGEKINSLEYLCLGHRRSVKKALRGAKVLLPNSLSEYKRLLEKYRIAKPHVIVPNAINKNLFLEMENLERSGVICVARIEPRKNQLNLIRAMKDLPFDLIIIGKNSPNHSEYYELCKAEAPPNVKFVDQIDQRELVVYYSKAKVHILPSWFETTGLSSLEAASCGCNIVVTPNGDTREYFGDNVFYCNPDSVESIKHTLTIAYEADANPAFKELIRGKYTWDEAARATYEGYKMLAESK
jgi:glycosyltransferase involved in cell wall biosynthesis